MKTFKQLLKESETFKVGDKVIANGYEGVVTKVHTDVRKGMVDVKLRRGEITIGMSSLKPVKQDVKESATPKGDVVSILRSLGAKIDKRTPAYMGDVYYFEIPTTDESFIIKGFAQKEGTGFGYIFNLQKIIDATTKKYLDMDVTAFISEKTAFVNAITKAKGMNSLTDIKSFLSPIFTKEKEKYWKDKKNVSESLNSKPSFGTNGQRSYAVKINDLDTNEFYTQSFGRSLSDVKKVDEFKKNSKKDWIGAKGKSTMPAVKAWIKLNNPSEFYCSWKSDSSFYKDDSVEIYYRK